MATRWAVPTMNTGSCSPSTGVASRSPRAPSKTAGPAASTAPEEPRKLLETVPVVDEDLFLGDDGAAEDEKDENDDEDDKDDEDDEDDEDDDDDDHNGSSDDDSDDFTYRPLSNLPTPPPSSHAPSVVHSPRVDGDVASSLLGPATHLVNMLPPAASLTTPSVPLVQAMLTRARLPLDTVALAVCILDSLDSRFARTWRQTCPLSVPSPNCAAAPGRSKRHTLPLAVPLSSPRSSAVVVRVASADTADAVSAVDAGGAVDAAHDDTTGTEPCVAVAEDRLLHIDAVFPEVIVLAALVIAAKFTDDAYLGQQPAQAYCTAWGGAREEGEEVVEVENNDDDANALSRRSQPDGAAAVRLGPHLCAGLWTGAQLAATERCIMQNLDYRIVPLFDTDLLADARADMCRTGAQARRTQRTHAQAIKATQAADPLPTLRRHHVPSRSECLLRRS